MTSIPSDMFLSAKLGWGYFTHGESSGWDLFEEVVISKSFQDLGNCANRNVRQQFNKTGQGFSVSNYQEIVLGCEKLEPWWVIQTRTETVMKAVEFCKYGVVRAWKGIDPVQEQFQ